MKTKSILFATCCLFAFHSYSQQVADTALLRTEMAKLSWMEGKWKGTASVQRGPGQPMIVNQEETVEFKLDGLVMLIEGLGKYKDPGSQVEKVGHHALAFVTYDPEKGQYRFQSYLNTGQLGDTYLKIIGENQYEWGFEGRVRYLITHNPAGQTWLETGEYSADNGTSWNKFIEMNLKKVK